MYLVKTAQVLEPKLVAKGSNINLELRPRLESDPSKLKNQQQLSLIQLV